MAWDPDDVGRSVKRYLAMTLDGPPWRIRTERREVRDDDRPVAVVDVGPQTMTRSREGTLHMGEFEYVVPVTITSYPAKLGSELEGRHDAELLRARLFRLISIGFTVFDAAEERNFAGPYRIPLWDWNDVSLTGDDKGDAGDPLDVIFVPQDSLEARIAQDPEDSRRYAVICEFRASVEAPGYAPEPAEPVTSLTAEGPGGDFVENPL